MDRRDKHLNRHMRKRYAIAARLSGDRQKQWASRCIANATGQGRTAYYLMARMWLAELDRALINA